VQRHSEHSRGACAFDGSSVLGLTLRWMRPSACRSWATSRGSWTKSASDAAVRSMPTDPALRDMSSTRQPADMFTEEEEKEEEEEDDDNDEDDEDDDDDEDERETDKAGEVDDDWNGVEVDGSPSFAHAGTDGSAVCGARNSER